MICVFTQLSNEQPLLFHLIAECCLSMTGSGLKLYPLCFFFQAEFTFRPAQEALSPSRLELLLTGFKSIPTAGQARLTGMSQLQYHCPASPMPAAPAPLPLGQPQPGYSIPCGSGTLPSESASQPIRSSALPAGSATPYTTTTTGSFFKKKYFHCLFKFYFSLQVSSW